MSLPCLFNCGGDTGPAQTTTQKSEVVVNTNTSVQGGPVNVTIGSDFLKPLGAAFSNTFIPIANSVEEGIKTSSNQAAALANQAKQIADFSQRSQTMIVKSQEDLALLVKILAVAAAGGVIFFAYRSGRA